MKSATPKAWGTNMDPAPFPTFESLRQPQEHTRNTTPRERRISRVRARRCGKRRGVQCDYRLLPQVRQFRFDGVAHGAFPGTVCGIRQLEPAIAPHGLVIVKKFFAPGKIRGGFRNGEEIAELIAK